MELLQIRDFGKSGLNSDLPKWDLPASFLTSANNFRIFSNKISPMGGSSKLIDTPAGFHPSHIISTPTPAANYWLLAGNGFYIYDGTNFFDIGATLPGFVEGDKHQWTSCKLGRVPVINNGTYAPTYWDDQVTGQDMQVLPFDIAETWLDKLWLCKSMRSFGPYLIAMNMTEDNLFYPDRVRWSHPAEQGMVPATWDETDPASLASRNDLSGDGGDIIDGLALRNSFVLYRDFGITTMNFSGDSFVFSFENLTSSIQIANINSIVEVKGRHFIISVNDIVMNTGDQIQSLMHNRLRVKFASTVNQDAIESAFGVHQEITKEFWAFVPTGDSIYPNQVWKYNYRDDAWSMHDIVPTAHSDFGALDRDSRIWQTWLEDWEVASGNWARQNNRVLNQTLLGVQNNDTATSNIQELDFYTTETPYQTILERTEFPLTNMQDVSTITRIYPHISGSIPVKIQVGSHQHAGGPARWTPERSFHPGTDRKVDVITTGELFAFRIIVDIETGGSFEFSGLDIEYTHAGLR